jgi:peptidoglycan/LPS O-acetylase OafA/YrhL
LVFLLVQLALLEDRVSSRLFDIFGFPLTSMLVVVLLIQFVFLGALRGWRWLDHPSLRFLGRISYSLYLYHIVVIATVEFYLMPALRLHWAIPVMYLGSVAAAYASYRLVEQPFLRLKNRFEPNSLPGAHHRESSQLRSTAARMPAV